MENFQTKIEKGFQRGHYSLFSLNWKGQLKNKDGEWIDVNDGTGIYIAIKSFYPIEIEAIALGGGTQKIWLPVVHKNENGTDFFYYSDGESEYRIEDYDIEQAHRNVPITYQLEPGIIINAMFTAYPNDEDGEIYYYHILTGQTCEEVGHVLSGWSEQDKELNEKWGRLVELIEEANEQAEDLSSYWWGDETPQIIDMG